jgi:long-chain acyl-CoA synthetase
LKTYANISALMDYSVKRFDEKVALQQLDSQNAYSTTTYKELGMKKLKIAIILSRMGLTKGDHVVMIGSNSPLWVIIASGIFHLGCVLVPVDCKSSIEEITHILKAADTDLVIHESILPEKDDSSDKSILSVTFAELADECEKVTGPEENVFLKNHSERKMSSPFDLALLVFTSGTTGVSKGVMLTHFNILSNLDGISSHVRIRSDDSVLSILPLSHMFEFTAGLLYPIMTGSTITFLRSLSGSEILKNMTMSKTSIMVVVPRILHLLQSNIISRMRKLPLWKQNLIYLLESFTSRSKWFARIIFKEVHQRFGGSIRFMVTGGAPIHRDTLLFFKNIGINIVQGYGLTETSPIISATVLEQNILGTTGHPLSNLKLKIDSPDESGVGEIIVSGPSIMKGYYKDLKSTEKVLSNGWFRTGDVGYLDSCGALVICGRIKALIITGSGKNIYPEELEKVYSQSDLIEEICVVSKSDGRGGEKPYAFVVPSADAPTDPEFAHKEISEAISSLSLKLSPFKHLSGWQIQREALPKTATQKIKRFLLQKELDDMEGSSKEIETYYDE